MMMSTFGESKLIYSFPLSNLMLQVSRDQVVLQAACFWQDAYTHYYTLAHKQACLAKKNYDANLTAVPMIRKMTDDAFRVSGNSACNRPTASWATSCLMNELEFYTANRQTGDNLKYTKTRCRKYEHKSYGFPDWHFDDICYNIQQETVQVLVTVSA